MNDNRIDTDVFHQNHVFSKTVFKCFVDHGVAAVFDHDGFVIKSFDEGERFNECLRLADEFFIIIYRM